MWGPGNYRQEYEPVAIKAQLLVMASQTKVSHKTGTISTLTFVSLKMKVLLPVMILYACHQEFKKFYEHEASQEA